MTPAVADTALAISLPIAAIGWVAGAFSTAPMPSRRSVIFTGRWDSGPRRSPPRPCWR